MLLYLLFLILIILVIYVVYWNQVRAAAASGQTWSGPCGLQCLGDATLAARAPILARVCVCQSCVCDLLSGLIRPNETLEHIHEALESFCDVACTQAKSVVDYITSNEASREIASTGILRAEVQSDRERPFNAAPTFIERRELIPPPSGRPDQDRVQPGPDLAVLEEELERLTKEVSKQVSLIELKREELTARLTSVTQGIKEELGTKEAAKTGVEIPESPQADEDISRVGVPTSSHASTSRRSCFSCVDDNKVCLGDCPNAKKDDGSVK